MQMSGHTWLLIKVCSPIKEKSVYRLGILCLRFFANYYLTLLDKFISETLGFKYRGRYLDDLVIISDDKKALLKAQPLIVKFAEEQLHVTIHKNKRYFQHIVHGVQFIGRCIRPKRKYIINRTVDSLYYKMKNMNKVGIKTPDDIMTVINSYCGFLCQNDTFNIRKKFFKSEVMKPLLEKYFDVAPGYKKLVFKPSYKEEKLEEFTTELEHKLA